MATKSTFSIIGTPVLGEDILIDVSAYSDDCMHQIYVLVDGEYIKVCEHVGGGNVFLSTDVGWASMSPYTTTVKTKIRLNTKFEGIELGYSIKDVYISIPENFTPMCEISLPDKDGYIAIYGAYIKGLSKIYVEVNASHIYGSPIVSYNIDVGGYVYTESIATVDTTNLLGEIVIRATVTDGRGRKGTTETLVTVGEKPTPRINSLYVCRCNEDGTENIKGENCLVKFNAEVLNLLPATTITYSLHYTGNTLEDSAEIQFDDIANKQLVEDYTYIFPADGGYSYYIILKITLNDGTETGYSTTLSTAFALLHFHKSGTSLGLGCVAEHGESLDVDLDATFRRTVTFDKEVYMNKYLFFNNRLTHKRTLGTVYGKIFDSEDGTAEGVGYATVFVDMTGVVRIDFSVKITKTGTVETIKYGLNWELIKPKCEWFFGDEVDVIPINSGTYTLFQNRKTLATYKNDNGTMKLEGYLYSAAVPWFYSNAFAHFMCAVGKRWSLGVLENYVEQADYAQENAWHETTLQEGEYITGTCYGYFDQWISDEI